MLSAILFFTYFHNNKYWTLIFSLICSIVICFKPYILISYNQCPDCFGNELCDSLENGYFYLSWLSRLLIIFNPKITKSVWYAKMNGSKSVVLKKMSRPAHFSVASKSFGLSINESFLKIISDNMLIGDDHVQNVILCPGTSSFPLLFHAIDDNLMDVLQNRNLWLNIKISIEPLLIKSLGLINGMPVPKYIGACGDVIVEEYMGKALSTHYTSHWMKRIYLSVELLKMAESFTFDHPSLIFYFTDITPDNVAVSQSGHVTLVDLDNVIITERREMMSGGIKTPKNVHVADIVDPSRLAISPSDICEYPISDLNYFIVCRYILIYSDLMEFGLLDDVPESIWKQYPNLPGMLDECGAPKKYNNRIDAGRQLAKILQEITHQFHWNGTI